MLQQSRKLGLPFTIEYLLYNKGCNNERAEPEDNGSPSEGLQRTVNETLSEQNSEKSEDLENEEN